MRNFFISYNQADRNWAEWIAWQLEEEGFTTILQAWDFRPSENFVLKMNEAIQDSERTIAVLSPDYLNALFTHPEWAAAFNQDPTSSKGVLLPVRVQECDPKGLFKQIIYIDLVGKDEVGARKALLSGIQRGRAKPFTKPEFPGSIPRSVSAHPRFPGPGGKKIPFKLLIALAIISAIGLIYAFWPYAVTHFQPPRPCQKLAGETLRYYEAEAADRSGDAFVDSEHLGYSGYGFVTGYGHGNPGTAATFWVEAPSDGEYQVDLCYANGTGSTKTLAVYVNGKHVTQTRLANTSRWNIWITQAESLRLRSGPNAISYRKYPSDSGQVNLDFVRIATPAVESQKPSVTPISNNRSSSPRSRISTETGDAPPTPISKSETEFIELVNYARLIQKVGSKGDACRLYQNAFKLLPDSYRGKVMSSLIEQANLNYTRNNFEEAVGLFEEAFRVVPIQ